MNSRKAASAPLLSTPLSPTSLACCTTSLDRCLWYNRRPALPCPDRSPEPVARWHGTRRVRLRTRRRKGTGPDKDGARTERKGLDDVGAAAEAAIDHDGDIACLFQDASQRLHRRDSVVQLSAAMICEDDPVHAAISCQGSVCGREDALDDQRCLPQTAYQPDVAPAQSLMWGNTGNLSREQPWSAPRFQIVDMRILPLHKDACEYQCQPARVRRNIPAQLQSEPNWKAEARPLGLHRATSSSGMIEFALRIKAMPAFAAALAIAVWPSYATSALPPNGAGYRMAWRSGEPTVQLPGPSFRRRRGLS